MVIPSRDRKELSLLLVSAEADTGPEWNAVERRRVNARRAEGRALGSEGFIPSLNAVMAPLNILVV